MNGHIAPGKAVHYEGHAWTVVSRPRPGWGVLDEVTLVRALSDDEIRLTCCGYLTPWCNDSQSCTARVMDVEVLTDRG
jgi:hypothetical protein